MVELLAPAGSHEAFKAALESGANAVYLGGRLFGARHYAPNFSDEDLTTAVREAHIRSVKVYVTVNTLVDDSEITELIDYLQLLYTIGVDAIIVQDMGVAKIAQTVVPNLPLHGSTQITVHNLAGVQFLESHGFKRIVVARELSIEDLRHICNNTSVEIEAFIHGALCISYSGQCLMSSLIGGRSGNRGKCAQPCRLPYSLVDESGENKLSSEVAGEYLLSPKDLCTIDLLPELIDAGVTSFKIEGRMKRAEYVAVVVDSYRRSIDNYLKIESQQLNEDKKNMAQIFNRGFTTAYLKNRPGKLMMSDRRPNNRGTMLGRVISYNHKDRTALIKLEDALSIGDVIEFWVKVGGRTNITVTNLVINGTKKDYAAAGTEVSIHVPTPVRTGDRIFKTFDQKLMEKARSFFAGADPLKRIPVDATVQATDGQPLTVLLKDKDGNTGRGQTSFKAEKARNRPLDYDTVAKQIGRLGTTIFNLDKLNCDIQGSLMVPVSEINEARRQAVEELISERLNKYKRPPLKTIAKDQLFNLLAPKQKIDPDKPLLVVNVDTVAKAETALANGCDVIMFGGESYQHRQISESEYAQVLDLARCQGKEVVFSTPRIIRENQLSSLLTNLALFENLKPDSVSIGNIGTLQLLKKFPALKISGDYPLNIYNSYAISFFAEEGLQNLTLSPELNFTQIEQLTYKKSIELECLVHGFLTLMVSEYCAAGSFLGELHTGKCSNDCRQGTFGLKDRKNEKFPLITDQYCRMHVLNAKELSMLPHVPKFQEIGIKRLRIEGKAADSNHLGKITALYREIINQGEAHPLLRNDGIKKYEHEDITRGHYFRGVL